MKRSLSICEDLLRFLSFVPVASGRPPLAPSLRFASFCAVHQSDRAVQGGGSEGEGKRMSSKRTCLLSEKEAPARIIGRILIQF